MLNREMTIGSVVADDYRAAAVFERYGIDFCCGGNRPIAEACQERGADDRQLLAELEATLASAQDRPRFAAWDLDFLATYIVNNHHAYVRQAVGPMQAHTRKVAEVHGDHHPEVREIAQRFDLVVADLTAHMAKEERVLFPYITRLAAAARGGEVPVAPFGTIANPIGMMEEEHRNAGDQMAAMRKLSAGFVTPPDACTTFTVTYQELQAFEADLHLHVHLENTILFPRALDLERELRQTPRRA
jgi:regulator of cell morphogenesis and NO signaling